MRRLTLVPLLAIANTALLLGLIAVGWQVTQRYGELVYAFNAHNAQKIADIAVANLAWREYARSVGEIGRNIVQSETLRTALAARAEGAIKMELVDEFGRGAISSGQIRALGFSAYDPDFNLIAEVWRGTAAAAIPAAVRDALAARRGPDRLKIASQVWMVDEEPRLSVFVPAGGLRPIGYIAIHADPIHALATLDQRLGMAVEIVALGKGGRLLATENYQIPPGAVVRENSLVVRGPDGESVANLKVRQDVTDLAQALRSTGLWSLGVLALIYGGMSAGALLLIAMYVRKVRGREMAAEKEIELKRREKAEADEARQLAEQKAEAVRREELLRLADDFEANVKSVADFVSSASVATSANAESLATVAQRTSDLAVATVGASGQTLANVQTVVTASEQLSESIGAITHQVTQSSGIATKAVAEANETNVAMRELSDSAQKIGEVVGLINAIAAQTNLLALNATIEAARAGAAGKGFAVVASEVKSLATQTAKATEEITAQVKAIQSSTRHAGAVIQRVGRTLDEISGIARNVTAAVGHQSLATDEIASNIATAATAAQDVASNIDGVERAAAETGHVAAVVLAASRDLAQQAETLRREVENFLSTVRADQISSARYLRPGES
jgi:methyl-accepting chemotaxis protein